MKKIRFIFALLVSGACAPAVTPTVTPAPVVVPAVAATVATSPPPPPAIHWYRNSAEMRGLYLEIYRTAGDQLTRLASAAAPDTWAVILDADETVLDNSEYEKERGSLPYSDSAWKEWVSREAATALPGSIAFIRHAQQLGGHVVIVTNRDSSLCDMTRENFRKDSIPFDLMLCRTTSSDKNLRFQAVENGTASPAMRQLKVLMWVGDNIQDFPSLTQTLRSAPDSAYNAFGTKYFLLPNPMYGSWEKVEYR
jgi:Predicted secreted acid phosphatase